MSWIVKQVWQHAARSEIKDLIQILITFYYHLLSFISMYIAIS
jgi:hypothetical protein